MILSTAIHNTHWQGLIAGNKFNIEQASKVLAADWTKAAESMNYPATIENALSINAPSIAVYRKYNNEAEAITLISRLIIWTLKMLNVQKSQNDFQVTMTAKMIMTDFYFLSVSELKYCFVRGIHGDYGQLYAKVDAMDLLKWLKEYSEQRSVYLVHRNQTQSKNEKQELKNVEFNPAFFQKVKETVERMENRQKEKERQRKVSLLQSRIDFAKRRIASLEDYKASEIPTQEQLEEIREAIANELINLEKLENELNNLNNESCKN